MKLEEIKKIIEEDLSEAGLPSDPREIKGRDYMFRAEHGSHNEILYGTVKALGISDEGGLDIYVSNPRFYGMRLISIKHTGKNEWSAFIDSAGRKLFKGDFSLL